jgi:hypothetical protein
MSTMDDPLDAVLSAHSAYLTREPNGKIKCSLNGHTMPPKAEVVQAFVR